MKKAVLKLLVWTLCISAGLGIIIILTGFDDPIGLKVLGTTALCFGYTLPLLCCSLLYEKKVHKNFAGSGIFFLILSFILSVNLIWQVVSFDLYEFMDTYARISAFSNILGISFAHIALLLCVNNLNHNVQLVRKLTIVVSIIFDIILIGLVWDMIQLNGDLIFRFCLVLVILIVLGSILLPILNKIYSNSSENDKLNNNVDNSIVNNTIYSNLDNQVQVNLSNLHNKENSLPINVNTIAGVNSSINSKNNILVDDNTN